MVGYLNQWWRRIGGTLWCSHKSSSTSSTKAIILFNEFENCTFEIIATSPSGSNELGSRAQYSILMIQNTVNLEYKPHFIRQ